MIIDNLVSPRNGSGQLNLRERGDRKSTRLNSSHSQISYAVFCLKKKKILDTSIFRKIYLHHVSASKRSPTMVPSPLQSIYCHRYPRSRGTDASRSYCSIDNDYT